MLSAFDQINIIDSPEADRRTKLERDLLGKCGQETLVTGAMFLWKVARKEFGRQFHELVSQCTEALAFIRATREKSRTILARIIAYLARASWPGYICATRSHGRVSHIP